MTAMKNDWQTWMLGTLLTVLLLSAGWNVSAFADEMKELKLAQMNSQQELAQRTTDIEVLKSDMRNQTELMKTMNVVLQQLADRSHPYP